MKNNTLLTLPIFKNIPQEDVLSYRQYIDFYQIRQEDVVCNTIISEVKNCFFVLSGKVRIVQLNKENDHALTFVANPSMGFGFDNFLENKSDYHLLATALEDTVLCKVSRDRMQEMLQDTKIMQNFCSFLLSMQYNMVSSYHAT